jgi:BirA family biotin operon repressor/biotin-[acetyl-CoA-carboxylase] ligase
LYAPLQFATLDIQIHPKKLVKLFIENLKKNTSWKQVFSKYEIEFKKSHGYTFHLAGKKVALGDAILLSDGSIEVENKKVYSLR